MALIKSKQLNRILSGSFSVTGNLNVTGSSSTGSFDRIDVSTISLTDAFTYGSTTWNEDDGALSVTGSDFLWKSTGGAFKVYDNSDALMFKIENNMAVFGALNTTPTATAGGMFYSGSDEWFMGFENEFN